MEDQYASADKIHFSISLSTDRDHFLRRTCPSCGRDFKTESNEADIAAIISPQFQRVGLEIGAMPGSQEEEKPAEYLYCPYCGHHAESSKTLPEDTVNYLHQHILREVGLPMVNKMFAGLEDDLGGSSHRSGGLISIHFEHSRSPLPPRPIHGPEPSDMKVVQLLCCGKKIKVAERWDDLRLCTYCGIPVTLM